MVQEPIGHLGLLSQSPGDARVAARGRLARFRRPRLSGPGRALHHRPRERHHHQGRPESVSRGAGGRGRARSRGAPGVRGGLWSARPAEWNRTAGGCRRGAQSCRGPADRAELTRAVDEAMGLPPDQVEILPRHSIPKTSSGKLRRSETRRLFLEGKLGKKLPPAWIEVAKLSARSAFPLAWLLSKRGAKRVIEFAYGVYALAMFALLLIPLWLLFDWLGTGGGPLGTCGGALG